MSQYLMKKLVIKGTLRADHISLFTVSATLNALRSHPSDGHLLLPGHDIFLAVEEVTRPVDVFRETKICHLYHIILVNPVVHNYSIIIQSFLQDT